MYNIVFHPGEGSHLLLRTISVWCELQSWENLNINVHFPHAPGADSSPWDIGAPTDAAGVN